MENTTALQMFNSTIKYSNEDIFIKPVCDFFGINYLNQCRIINSDDILQTSHTKKYDMLLFGDKRKRVALTKKGFFRWVQLINPQIVHVTLRESLKKFQTFIFEFLYGNLENEQSVKIMHQRLKKLKRLKTKINIEIKRCDGIVKSYLENKFTQQRLDM